MQKDQRHRFGERLPNGATVIASKPIGDGPHQIVLAYTGSGSPFVTWEEYHHPGSRPATGNGHYFDDIAKAAADFRDR